MTKKEFIERVKEFRIMAERCDYYFLTCLRIKGYISIDAHHRYTKFIKIFLSKGDIIKYKYNDKSGYPMILRCMLTEAFFEECLQTKKYKEF